LRASTTAVAPNAATEVTRLATKLPITDRRRLRINRAIIGTGSTRLAFERHPELSKVTGLSQNEARARFRRIDREIMELQRAKLASRLAAAPVHWGNGSGRKSEYTGKALIYNEIGKKRVNRHRIGTPDRHPKGTPVLGLSR
jgi:hypothetical protein